MSDRDLDPSSRDSQAVDRRKTEPAAGDPRDVHELDDDAERRLEDVAGGWSGGTRAGETPDAP